MMGFRKYAMAIAQIKKLNTRINVRHPVFSISGSNINRATTSSSSMITPMVKYLRIFCLSIPNLRD